MSHRDDNRLDRFQIEDLRKLEQARRSGKISEQKFKEASDHVRNRTVMAEAMSRTPEGVRTSAVGVHSSHMPRFLKALVGVAILVVAGFVGYALIADRMETFPEEEKLAAEEDISVPVIESVSDTPPEAAVAVADVSEPVAAEAPVETEQSVSTAALGQPDFNAAVASLPGTDSAIVPVNLTPVEPVEPVRAETVVMVEADEAELGNLNSPASELAWLPPWPEYEPNARHPFNEWCELIFRIDRGSKHAIVGVLSGPEAVDFDDREYRVFRDDLRIRFKDAIESADPGSRYNFLVAPRPRPTANDVLTERITATKQRSANIGVIITAVQDGRCIAYCFEGNRGMLREFEVEIGTASFE